MMMPQIHFPTPGEAGSTHSQGGQQQQSQFTHHHIYQDGNAGQGDQYQGQASPFSSQDSPVSSTSEEGQSDPEKVMYIYVDEDGKTVASKVADSNVGPEVALPEGYVVRQVGGSAPPPEDTNSQPLPSSDNSGNTEQPAQEGQQDPSTRGQQTQEMSYGNAQSFGENVVKTVGPQTSGDDSSAENPPPASVSYATEQEVANAASQQQPREPTVPVLIATQQDAHRLQMLSYAGHEGQFLVRLKKKPQEYQQEFPTTPSGQLVTPVVTSADAIESTLSPPDSNQDMVFMLGDYKNYLNSQGALPQPQAEQSEVMQNDGVPHADSNASPLADDFLASLTGHTTPAQDDYLERAPRVHIHSSPPHRPPIRGIVGDRTSHGGWIPIPRSQPLPPTTGSYHRDANDVGNTDPSKKEEEKKEAVAAVGNLSQSGSSHSASHVAKDEEKTATSAPKASETNNHRQPKVHFDDSVDTEDSHSNSNTNNDNSGQSSHTRVSYSVSSSISSVTNKNTDNLESHRYNHDEIEESTPAASEKLDDRRSPLIRDEEVMREASTAAPATKPPSIQKRSKYNVAAVFDHEFKPIFTPSKNLEDLRDHEIIAAPKGSFGLRLAPGQTRTTRSLFVDKDSSDAEGQESSVVPSSSSSSPFTQRKGLLSSDKTSSSIEESLKKQTGQFLVPIPGSDGKIKAYVVLSK
jgi:hypothetical protein